MVSIVLLADQERLVNIFSQPGAFPGARIRIAGGIEDIIASRSTRSPGFIFIQERLGEVSGTVIAHRLADEFKGRKTRLVLFGSPETDSVAGRPASVTLIDVGLSDQELMETIRNLLTAPPAVGKKRQAPKKKPAPAVPAERADSEQSPPPPANMVADVVEIGTTSPSRSTLPVGGAPASAVQEPVESLFEQKLSHALQESPASATANRAEPSTSAGILPEAASAVPKSTHRATPAGHPRIGMWLRRPRLAAVTITVVVGIAVLTLYQALRSGSPEKEGMLQKEASQSSGSASRQITTLPSFIPRMLPDAAYGKAHPGWERYRNDTAEFRIYRNGKIIEAIQVVDRSGRGVDRQLFSAALTEIAGSVRYVIESSDTKGAYVVENGRLSNGMGIIIYRKESSRNVIRAFVIDLR